MNPKIMPFGAHKGEQIANLSDSYLGWLYSQEWLRPPLKLWVEAEFLLREAPLRGGTPRRAGELIDAGFKALARVHHPDVGGTNEAMRESLEARYWLIRMMKQ